MKTYRITVVDDKRGFIYRVWGCTDSGRFKLFGTYDTFAEAKREANEEAKAYGSSNQMAAFSKYTMFEVKKCRPEEDRETEEEGKIVFSVWVH